jgi:hypothetical protein
MDCLRPERGCTTGVTTPRIVRGIHSAAPFNIPHGLLNRQCHPLIGQFWRDPAKGLFCRPTMHPLAPRHLVVDTP